MDHANYVQLALSAAALGLLLALAAWLKLSKPAPPLDEARARKLLAEAFPGRRLDAVWIGASGKGALAKSGAAALVVCAVGEGFVIRWMPWAQALAITFKTGRLTIDLADVDAPVAVLTLAVEPPSRSRRLAA
jgi:hypothetical protein